MVEHHDTMSQRHTIDADSQTSLDQAVDTHASLVPGSVNLMRENFDARVDISRGFWQLRVGVLRRDNWSYADGVAPALDSHNRYGSERWKAE